MFYLAAETGTPARHQTSRDVPSFQIFHLNYLNATYVSKQRPDLVRLHLAPQTTSANCHHDSQLAGMNHAVVFLIATI